MDNLQERAALLFIGAHISKFVYVDDEFGNPTISKEQCKLFVKDNLDKADFITHPEIWGEEFEEWWKNSSDENHLEYSKKWGIDTENTNHLQEILTEIIPANIEQFYLSPQEFEVRREEMISNLDDSHQLMILVDYILDGYERNGEQVLDQFADSNYVSCALFSGTFSIEEELKRWDTSETKANIFVLSKERMESDDGNKILEGIRNVLWLKQISKIKQYAKKVIQESIDYMGKKLDAIDPSTFHKIVMDRSAMEGCWEFETMMRIVKAYMGIGLNNYMIRKGFTSFQDLTRNLRDIKSNAEAYSSNKNIIADISTHEIYESGEYINQTFSQISNGDIFKIGDGNKEFILLCQPCNLEIRTNGYRSKKTFDQFYLVPIRKLKEGDKEHPYMEILQSASDSDLMVAELCNYFRISLSLLDLVSFNPEGKAVIDLSETSETHPYRHILQENMMIHYNLVHDLVLSYKSKYDKIKGSDLPSLDNEAIRKAFCHPYELGDPKMTKHPVISFNNQNRIDFRITRTRRYKDPYAKDLLQLFMNYLSRPAYAMDLQV